MNKNESEVKLFSAKFKRDYVAYLAVVLFLVIVICEVTMAVSLPVLVRQKDLWDQQAGKQEMTKYFDHIREGMRDITEGSKNDRIVGEAGLVVIALDEMAIYLHDNADFMERPQMEMIRGELDRISAFKNRYENTKKSYSSQQELNSSDFLKKLEEQYIKDSESKK